MRGAGHLRHGPHQRPAERDAGDPGRLRAAGGGRADQRRGALHERPAREPRRLGLRPGGHRPPGQRGADPGRQPGRRVLVLGARRARLPAALRPARAHHPRPRPRRAAHGGRLRARRRHDRRLRAALAGRQRLGARLGDRAARPPRPDAAGGPGGAERPPRRAARRSAGAAAPTAPAASPTAASTPPASRGASATARWAAGRWSPTPTPAWAPTRGRSPWPTAPATSPRPPSRSSSATARASWCAAPGACSRPPGRRPCAPGAPSAWSGGPNPAASFYNVQLYRARIVHGAVRRRQVLSTFPRQAAQVVPGRLLSVGTYHLVVWSGLGRGPRQTYAPRPWIVMVLKVRPRPRAQPSGR